MKRIAAVFSTERTLIVLIALGFIAWSAAFIRASSFITIDGRRSFALFDDAMISMRYAWNFSHGHGLVWNPGEYVQGYTNLLMTLIMSLATLVLSKTLAVLAIQLLGVILMLTVAYLSMELAVFVIQPTDGRQAALVRIVGFALGLSYYPLAFWSLMGMESGLQTVLLMAGLLLSLRYARSWNPRTLLGSAVCFGLAFLTRNETALFVPLAWGYVLWQSRGRGARLALAAAAGVYLVFILGQFSFQYLYYGEALPNTYTLKLTGLTLAQRVQNGLGFISHFLHQAWLIVALALAAVVVRFSRVKLLLGACIVTAMAYQVYVGGDVWAYWRLVAPVIPLALLLNFALAQSLAGMLVSRAVPAFAGRVKRPLAAVLAIALLLPGLWRANAPFWSEIAFQDRPFMMPDNKENVNKSIALNELLREDATLGVVMAGVIPYYVDRPAIDFLGKSDRYIAHLPPDTYRERKHIGMLSVPGHNKYDLIYSIVGLRPTYVERLDFGRYNLAEWGEDHYVKVIYKGYTLFLLEDSESVLWSKLEPAE